MLGQPEILIDITKIGGMKLVNSEKVAIADVLKHKILGLVSHQPDLNEEITRSLRVMDSSGKIYYVHDYDCDFATREEMNEYWQGLKADSSKGENQGDENVENA